METNLIGRKVVIFGFDADGGKEMGRGEIVSLDHNVLVAVSTKFTLASGKVCSAGTLVEFDSFNRLVLSEYYDV